MLVSRLRIKLANDVAALSVVAVCCIKWVLNNEISVYHTLRYCIWELRSQTVLNCRKSGVLKRCYECSEGLKCIWLYTSGCIYLVGALALLSAATVHR